jgi:transcription antitermination protein NusB
MTSARAPEEGPGVEGPRPDRRRSRHESRRVALELLYEADLRERPIPVVMAERMAGEDPPPDFAIELVRGVHRHRPQLDALIEASAREWTLARMPVIDRNVLRIGLYEILHADEIPTAVAIDEAVELAKELSTEDSGRFVNGILARVAATTSPPGGAPPGVC